MKDVNKPYISDISTQTDYKLNVKNIKTIKDIKLVLKHLDLHYTPKNKEDYNEIKHLLIIN